MIFRKQQNQVEFPLGQIVAVQIECFDNLNMADYTQESYLKKSVKESLKWNRQV